MHVNGIDAFILIRKLSFSFHPKKLSISVNLNSFQVVIVIKKIRSSKETMSNEL